MNTLKKAYISSVTLVLGAWATATWAAIPTVSAPEPSTLALVAGGIAVGALARYLRKRK